MAELDHPTDQASSNLAQPDPAAQELSAAPAGALAVAKARQGFGGCLLYPLFFLAAQPVLFVIMLLQSSGNSRVRVFWPYLIYDLLLLAVVGILLTLFLRKKATLPALFIFLLIGMAVVSGLVTNLFWRLPEARVTGRDPMMAHLALLINCVILIPLFARDDRTKNTFVREAEPDSGVDRLVRPIVPIAQRLYGWLERSGKNVFWYPIVLVAIMFAFDWLVDSIVLNVLIK